MSGLSEAVGGPGIYNWEFLCVLFLVLLCSFLWTLYVKRTCIQIAVHMYDISVTWPESMSLETDDTPTGRRC